MDSTRPLLTIDRDNILLLFRIANPEEIKN